MKADTQNPIEAAVAPLKADAVLRAEQEAREMIRIATDKLEAAGWDLDKVAPRPNGSMRRADYKFAEARRASYSAITTTRPTASGVRFQNDPWLVDLCPERVERFIESSKEDAAVEHDAFVAKLVEKIGPCVSAELSGNHVWNHSILRAVKTDGTFEVWKTRMIVNRSCLGKLFNQFPTRRA